MNTVLTLLTTIVYPASLLCILLYRLLVYHFSGFTKLYMLPWLICLVLLCNWLATGSSAFLFGDNPEFVAFFTKSGAVFVYFTILFILLPEFVLIYNKIGDLCNRAFRVCWTKIKGLLKRN